MHQGAVSHATCTVQSQYLAWAREKEPNKKDIQAIHIINATGNTFNKVKIYLAASERLIFLSQNMSVVSTVQLYMITCVLGYIFQHSSLLEGA